MREYGHAKLFLRPPHVGVEDKKFFSLEELEEISQYTGIPITVFEGFAGYTAIIFDEYFDTKVAKKFTHVLEEKLGRKVCFLDDPETEQRKGEAVTVELKRKFSRGEVESASHFYCEGKGAICDIEIPRYWDCLLYTSPSPRD